MEPKWLQNLMFWGSVFLILFFDVVEGVFWYFHMFSHHAMTSFLTQNTVFFCIFLTLHFARSIERAKPNTSKIEPKMIKKSMQHRTKHDSKINLFLDTLWRCPTTSIWGRFWGRFGIHFGSILGLKIGLKAIRKKFKKMVEKKSRRSPPGRAGNLACGPLTETSQTGDWQLAIGN